MLSIEPSEAALLVIDVQNAYCSPDGTLGKSGVDMTSLVAIEEPVRRLVEGCRALGIPDIWTEHGNLLVDKARDRHKITPHTKKRVTISCQPGTWDAEFISGLSGLASTATFVVKKYRWGAFYGTSLSPLLSSLGTKMLILAGSTANACIETTAREAYMRDYDVVFAADAIGSVREDWYVAARKVWEHYIGSVTTVDEILAAATSHGGQPA